MVHLKRILCLFIVVFISLIFVTPWNLPFSRPAPAPEPTPAPTPMPTPEVTPVPFADGFDLRGSHYSIDVTELDLSGLSESDSADIETFCRVAPYANNLKNVNLGNEASSPVNWNMIAQLQEAAPDVHFSYSFSLYGEPMTLDTEYIDLRKIPVDDNGAAVVSALPCMKKCTTLDMDQSGVDSEHMAMIRDAFPNVKVIWRVWFSILDYSCRTDAKTILCSLAGDSGLTDEESCKPLTYCTEVVNLDVGHNNHMRTLSFLRYMPNLEIFITYNNYLRDVDDLAYCKKLRYVELYGSSMYNINSIAELYELTDLQLGGCYNLTDISPIIPADRVPKIKRLWLTPGYIPQEQIDEFQRNHPNCEINDTDDSVGYYWRFIDPIHTFNTEENRTPAYQELVNIFHYGADDNQNYSFSRNDPYYTTPHGEPVTGERVQWFYG